MDGNQQQFVTSYYIDGFRSLREFHLDLQPGINALVGPNGSGKTNFLDFLGFLERAVSSGVTNAVSEAGGLSRVFSFENTSRHSAHLTARICGTADLNDVTPSEVRTPFFHFEYEITIRFSREYSSVYIHKEQIKIKKLFSEKATLVGGVKVGNISITRKSASEDSRPTWHVGSRLYTDNSRNPLAFSDSYTPYKGKIADRLSSINLAPDQSILSVGTRYYTAAIEAIRLSIVRGRSFNISPEKCRTPDDITRSPGIMRDGSGLTATMHALQKLRRGTSRRILRIRNADKDTLSEIIEWTRLVFPDLIDITSSQDPHTGKYICHLIIGDNSTLKLPLHSASDGTLKWLSLVTLILCTGGVYSVEEPENFLHPKMQQFLVQLIREYGSPRKAGGYFLFSTHSETIVNYCKPEELVLFDFQENRTVSGRVTDPERIREEINETGFGLGYYYASNSLPSNTSPGRGDDGEIVYK